MRGQVALNCGRVSQAPGNVSPRSGLSHELVDDAVNLASAALGELPVRAVVGALRRCGVTLQGLEGIGGVADEGLGESAVGVGGVVAGDGADDLGFEAADAGDAPAGLGHFLDEELLMDVPAAGKALR